MTTPDKPAKGPEDTPLTVSIEPGLLVIKIGVATLAHSAEYCPEFYDGDAYDGGPYIKVVDVDELARDVAREIQREEEDGTTPLHTLLDNAIVAAREDGSLAFDDDEETP